MKIYISADLEGIAGVVHPEQLVPGGYGYEDAIFQLHQEINAIITGLFKAGANEIVVNDAHCFMRNINLKSLNPRVSLITGKPKYISMMNGLDSSFDAVILLGYHAMAGSLSGVLAHTFSFKLNRVILNGKPVGEAEINTILAAQFGVPVMLITGDDVLAEQVYENIGAVPYYTTKEGISKCAAKCLPQETLLRELSEIAYASLKDPVNWIINGLDGPYTIEISFVDPLIADIVGLIPNVCRLSGTSVSFSSENYSDIYRFLQVCSYIAG